MDVCDDVTPSLKLYAKSPLFVWYIFGITSQRKRILVKLRSLYFPSHLFLVSHREDYKPVFYISQTGI